MRSIGDVSHLPALAYLIDLPAVRLPGFYADHASPAALAQHSPDQILPADHRTDSGDPVPSGPGREHSDSGYAPACIWEMAVEVLGAVESVAWFQEKRVAWPINAA